MHQCPVDNINVVFKNQDFQTSDGVLMGNVLIALHCKQTFFCLLIWSRLYSKTKCTWKRKHSLWPLTCHLVYRRCIINKQLLHLFLHWLDISHRTWNNEEIRVICFISKYLRSTRIKFNIYTTYAFFHTSLSFSGQMVFGEEFWNK